jgi:hypothetical protein
MYDFLTIHRRIDSRGPLDVTNPTSWQVNLEDIFVASKGRCFFISNGRLLRWSREGSGSMAHVQRAAKVASTCDRWT